MARRLPLDNPDHHKDLSMTGGDWNTPFRFLAKFIDDANSFGSTQYTGATAFLKEVSMALIGSGNITGNLYKRLRSDYAKEVEKMYDGEKVDALKVRKFSCLFCSPHQTSPSPSCIGKNNYRSAG